MAIDVEGLAPTYAPEVKLYAEPVPSEVATADKQQFKVSAEKVRKNGDAIDVTETPFWRNPGIYGTVAVGSIINEGNKAFATAPEAAIFGSAMVSSVAVLGTLTGIIVQEGRQEKAGSVPLVDAGNQRYELYRIHNTETQQDEVVARWYGTQAPSVPQYNKKGKLTGVIERRKPLEAESLRTVAMQAEAADVNVVFVGKDLLDTYTSDATQLGAEKVSAVDWLRHKKVRDITTSRKTGDNTLDLYAMTPSQLNALADRIGENGRRDDYDLKSSVDYVRKFKPDHPIVQQYDRYHSDKSLVMSKTKAEAVALLERNLADVERDNGMKTKTDQPQRRTRHLNAKITDDKVVWTANGIKFEEKKLLNASGYIDEKQVKEVLQNKSTHLPEDVIKAIEYTTAIQSQTNTETVGKTEEKPLIQLNLPYAPALALAVVRAGKVERFAKPIEVSSDPITNPVGISRTRRAKTLATAMIGVATVTTSPLLLSAAAEPQINAAKVASEKAYAAENLTHAEYLDETERKKAHDQALDGRPLLKLYESIDSGIDKFYKTYDSISNRRNNAADNQAASSAPVVTGHSELSLGTGNQGGVAGDNKEDMVLWDLKPTGNVDTKGYWTLETAATFKPDGSWESYSLSEPGEYLQYDSEGINALRDTSYEAVPQSVYGPAFPDTIEVSRDLIPTDQLAVDYGGDGTVEAQRVRVPVLDGMEVVAANYNGEDVTLMRRSAGTTGITFDNNYNKGTDKRRLTYTLAPIDETRQSRQYFVKPRALMGNRFSSAFYDDPDATYGGLRDDVEAAWESHNPRNLAASGDVALHQDVQYVRNHTRYNLKPLPPSFAEQLHAPEKSARLNTSTRSLVSAKQPVMKVILS